MHIVAGLREACSIIAAQSAGADDGNAWFFGKRSAHNAPVVTKIAEEYNLAVRFGRGVSASSSQVIFTCA
jgi:hypothetical protein